MKVWEQNIKLIKLSLLTSFPPCDVSKGGFLVDFCRLHLFSACLPWKQSWNPPQPPRHDILSFFNTKIIAAALLEHLHMTGRLLSHFSDKEVLAQRWSDLPKLKQPDDEVIRTSTGVLIFSEGLFQAPILAPGLILISFLLLLSLTLLP